MTFVSFIFIVLLLIVLGTAAQAVAARVSNVVASKLITLAGMPMQLPKLGAWLRKRNIVRQPWRYEQSRNPLGDSFHTAAADSDARRPQFSVGPEHQPTRLPGPNSLTSGQPIPNAWSAGQGATSPDG